MTKNNDSEQHGEQQESSITTASMLSSKEECTQNVTTPATSSSPPISTTTTATTTSQVDRESLILHSSSSSSAAATSSPKKQQQPRRIIRRNRNRKSQDAAYKIDPVLLQHVLKESNLPIQSYSFEIEKTVQRIVSNNISHVALQLPEGLLLYATVLGDVLKKLSNGILQHVSILGDVTYGACCIDDLGATALGAQLLVHYGHSCLVPIQHTQIPCLYVFVELTIDLDHFVQCLHLTIQQELQENDQDTTTCKNKNNTSVSIYLLGTIQFRHALGQARDLLQERYTNYTVAIPQVKPLSPGEVLGCTSPRIPQTPNGNHNNTSTDSTATISKTFSYCCFVADGRFHLESTLIQNPHLPFLFRYDPYSKTMTKESYRHDTMTNIRRNAISQTLDLLLLLSNSDSRSNTSTSPNTSTTNTNNNGKVVMFGIILGTLGRQGNPAIVQHIQGEIREWNTRIGSTSSTSTKDQDFNETTTLKSQQQKQTKIKSFVLLLSEITPSKLALMQSKVNAWIQVACPRLSVDWGHFLSNRPVLNAYEFHLSMQLAKQQQLEQQHYSDMDAVVSTLWTNNDKTNNTHYPMDYYSNASMGPWSNYHEQTKDRQYHI